MNAYTQLVEGLTTGEITLTHIDIAVMEWINNRKDLPEGVKSILAVPEGGGLIRDLFQQIKKTIGNIELAYRRGQQDK